MRVREVRWENLYGQCDMKHETVLVERVVQVQHLPYADPCHPILWWDAGQYPVGRMFGTEL